MKLVIYMKTLSERINKIKELLEESEYIVIGAGAGLSSAAGLTYDGDRFKDNFNEYIDKYDMTDMYTAGFYPFETIEEKWGYWAKHIYHNVVETEETALYKKLFQLVKDRNYFVITTNVDDQFVKSGFPSQKVFATQGSYSYFQCSRACHKKLYYNHDIIREMVKNIDEDLKIPTELIPYCPLCGQPLETNLRKDNYFVEDEHWHLQSRSYHKFLNDAQDSKTLLLEFGIGYNTPAIIRFPFESMTAKRSKWTLARFNRDYLEVAVKSNANYMLLSPEKLEQYDNLKDFVKRYIPLNEDIESIIDYLLKK